MKSSIWLTMTRPIFLHSLVLPDQSGKRKAEEGKEEEKQDAKEAADKSALGCLYSSLEMFLTQDQRKMTDLHTNWKRENCKDAARFRFDPVIKAKKSPLCSTI